MTTALFLTAALLAASPEPIGDEETTRAELVVLQRNEIDRRMKLVGVEYRLDGEVIHRAYDLPDTQAHEDVAITSAEIEPGLHQLEVTLHYRGAGLSYARDYRYELESDYEFIAKPGETIMVRARPWAKKGPTLEVEDQPQMAFESNVPPRVPEVVELDAPGE